MDEIVCLGFGAGCPHHAECALYQSVEGRTGDEREIVNCRAGDEFPMFIKKGLE